MRAICAIIHHYQVIHLTIGILGNATFPTGSLLFLHDVKPWSIYLFSSAASEC
jgi:hypothetical protein